MNEIPKTDPQVRVEVAREAKDALENRALMAAFATLQKQWYGELMTASTDRETAEFLRAKLQTLEALPQMLRSIMAAPQFAQRGHDVRRTG